MTLKKSAFSLLELLVAITIIALLVGILLPSLGSAKKAASKSKNATHMRGIVQGAIIYAADDFNNKLPTKMANGSGPFMTTATVFNTLVNADLSAELLINPEDAVMSLDVNGTIEYTSANSAEFSYSWLNTMSRFYDNSTIAKTPLIADRETDTNGTYSEGSDKSIWTLISGDIWEGGVAWADGHASHETTKTMQTNWGPGGGVGVDIHDISGTSNAMKFSP